MVRYLINDVDGKYVSIVQQEQCNGRTEMVDCLEGFINISTGVQYNKRYQDIFGWNVKPTCLI